ncbi:FtsB family cell division protein [Companilactobacillus jidongensis]|uniref:FtsB family cell division protein n=1 Tax=Companilactobacillus jidongensis TaxID=2486006 RepID=UPI000F79DC1E|nr:septum formation initiator family protein [Companilactobacillus jidongensis]
MEVRKLANSNVSVLEPKQQKTSTKPGRSDFEKKVHKRRLVAIGVMFAIVLFTLGFQIISAHMTYTSTAQSIEVSQKKLNKQKATQSDLKVEINQLKDKNYLERYIREKYMYSKPGELVYNLPDNVNAIQK